MYYINNEDRYRKTENTFRNSRASISRIIRRVSHDAMTFVSPKLIRLPTTAGEVQRLTDGYLDAHGFPQCIGAVDGIHIKIAETSEH